MRQGCQFFPFLFNLVPEVSVGIMSQEKEIKGIQIEKKQNITIFRYYVLYLKYSKDLTRKLSEWITLSRK